MHIIDFFEGLINDYLDQFVNTNVIVSERRQTYAKNIAGVSLVAAVSVPLFAVLYAYIGLHIGAVGIIGGGLGIMISPYILKHTQNILLARTMILVSLYLTFLIICFSTQGIQAACTYWLLSIPVTAVFMGGIIPGIFWSCVVTGTVIFMHCYEISGGTFMNQTTDHRLLLLTASITGLILVVTSLTMLFESSKNQSYLQVKKAKTTLEKTTEELTILINMISSSIIRTKRETGIISDKAEIMANAMHKQESLLESAAKTMTDIAKHTQSNTGNAAIAKKEALYAGELASLCEEILRMLLQKMIEVSDLTDNVIDSIIPEQTGTSRNTNQENYKRKIDRIAEDIARINIIAGKGKTEALNANPKVTDLLSSSKKVSKLVSQVYLNSHQQALSNEIAASNINSIKNSAKDISASSSEIANSVKSLDDSIRDLEIFLSTITDKTKNQDKRK